MCFVSLCCSIFKDRLAFRFLADSLYSISQLLRFVNTFFESFLSFFRTLFAFAVFPQRTCIISYLVRFVNTFFQLFSGFFFLTLCCGFDLARFCASYSRTFIISHHIRFVNTFFQVFSGFFNLFQTLFSVSTQLRLSSHFSGFVVYHTSFYVSIGFCKKRIHFPFVDILLI